MPYIDAKANVRITTDAAVRIKSAFGEAIALLPGKSEQWLMISLNGGADMWFQGTDAPCAMINVSVFGGLNSSSANQLTAALTETIQKELDIPAERVYVSYRETKHWGWNGSNF